MEPLKFTVDFKRLSHAVELPATAAMADLAALLADQCKVAPETIKLLVPGKAGMIKAAEQPQRLLQEAGINPGAKLRMMASAAGEVETVQHGRDLLGLAPLEHELRRDMARAAPPAAAARPAEASPYTFEQLRAWERPGLHPPPSEALKLLHRVASDPGVAGVMAKHRWRVGVLSEMPPEGLVGVSPVCILGVNINRGQQISLRLRTDDLRGFRRYDRIVETMLHELAHMEHSEHDDAFKALNSQLRREAAALDWQRAPAAQLGLAGGAYGGRVHYDLPPLRPDVMAETAQLSGRSLRELAAADGQAGEPAVLPARAAAVQAALHRAQAAAAAAGEGAGGAPSPPRQPPPGQQPAAERQYRKGDLVWYLERDGGWLATQVVHVERAVQPPSYGISLGEGDKGSYRETEAHRLQPRREGEGPPTVEVEGLGHFDGGTAAKEDEVRRQLEQ